MPANVILVSVIVVSQLLDCSETHVAGGRKTVVPVEVRFGSTSVVELWVPQSAKVCRCRTLRGLKLESRDISVERKIDTHLGQSKQAADSRG